MEQKTLSTIELAALFKVTAQTVRTNLCLHGHFQGLKPRKMPNRLLLWNADDAYELAGLKKNKGE